jgi:hypothetical protein
VAGALAGGADCKILRSGASALVDSGPSAQKERRSWNRKTRKRVAALGALVLPVHVPAEKGRVGVDHPAPASLVPAHLHAIAEKYVESGFGSAHLGRAAKPMIPGTIGGT